MLSHLLSGSSLASLMHNPFWMIFAVLIGENILRSSIIIGIPQLLLMHLPRLTSYRFTQEKIPSHQQRTELIHTLLTIIAMALTAIPLAYLLFHAGWYSIHEPSSFSWGRFFGEALYIVALHDLYFYATHALLHHPRLFRFSHATHHISRIPQPLTAYNFAIPEAIVTALFIPLYLVLTSALLGGIYYPAALFFLAFSLAANVWQHSCIEPFPAWWVHHPLTKHIATPTFHYLHHARNRGNFGFYTTIWDRLFGTMDTTYETAFTTHTTLHKTEK